MNWENVENKWIPRKDKGKISLRFSQEKADQTFDSQNFIMEETSIQRDRLPVLFEPRLWEQRRTFISKVLRRYDCEKV